MAFDTQNLGLTQKKNQTQKLSLAQQWNLPLEQDSVFKGVGIQGKAQVSPLVAFTGLPLLHHAEKGWGKIKTKP